ncbi:MAG: nucleotidyltransferase family protein [Lachnospiraceae bacterium]|nr:nucleotidyltransferase family protein [Lachnospiraceae bacterium]
MRIAAVMEDFNTFAEGAWQQGLAAAIRKKTGADAVIAAMAGDFLENSFPAVEEKYRRAEWVCAAGIDLVLELPVSVCLSDLATKAFSGLSMLKRLYGIKDLVILCRQVTGERLSEIADFIFRASPEYQAQLKKCLNRESDFFAAQAQAVELFFPGAAMLLDDPYNRAAIELLKARYQLYWTIKPIFLDIAELESEQRETQGQEEKSRFFGRQLCQLFQKTPEQELKQKLEATPDGGPELLEYIWGNLEELKRAESLEEMIQSLAIEHTKSKPMEESKIRAFFMKLLLGIQRGNLIICGLRANCPYVRVLGVRTGSACSDRNEEKEETGHSVLGFLEKTSWVPMLVEVSYEKEQIEQERKKLDECGQMLAALDDRAHELYLQSEGG